jgi:signal transduction histidine kinase
MTKPTLNPHKAELLIAEAQKRADELELTNHELNLLYKTSEMINSANTYAEVVEAVAQFDTEADVVTLMLWDTWDWETAQFLDVHVVIDRHASGKLPVGSRLPKEAFPIAKHMMGHKVWLFEDAETDPRVDPLTAESWAALGIRSFMGPALYLNKRWLGGITFHSSKARTYTEREERLLAGVGDLVLAAVVRIRLQNETETSRQHAEMLAHTNAELLRQAQQRTTELEAANSEIDLMYRIGEGINAANTYTELVNAVSGIIEGATAVALFFWEGNDYQSATYVEQVAATGYLVPHVGHRVPKAILAYTAQNPTDRLMVFEDVTTDPRFNNTTASHYLARQLQAAISIRLYVQNRWVGALVFNSYMPHVFTERDKRLASGVGDYVVGAVERIRLQNEKEQARQQAETLGNVHAMLSRATDEQGILNAVAELFQNLEIAWFGLAYSLNTAGQELITTEYVATLPATQEAYPAGIFDLNDYPCLKTAYHFPQAPVFVENIETDPRSEFTFLLTKPETAMWRAVVLMPLQTGDQWHGLLSFYWYEAQVFSSETRASFAAIMPNVASIVTTRKAYLAEQEARKENELLYKASKGINNAATVDEIITALEQLNLPALDIALAVWESYDRNTANYLEVSAGSASSTWCIGQRLTIQEMQIAYSTAHHLLVVVDDSADGHQIDHHSARTIEAQDYQALMLVHLLVVNHCIGILMFSSRAPRVFSPHEKRLAAGIGELVTAAIERMRLRDESEAARREAEAHAQQAQKLASLEERTRLARELHDSVSQVLYGIGLGARTACAVAKQNPEKLNEPLDYILSLAEAGLTEMRALIFELRPESLEQEGLITTLNKQALSIAARYGIHVETEFCQEPDLPFDVKESIYRIVREALHNTVKHAQATSVSLAMLQTQTGYYLIIEDNGLGFDTTQNFAGHLGLKSMRERTANLGGVLEITSAVGAGTTITITINTEQFSA